MSHAHLERPDEESAVRPELAPVASISRREAVLTQIRRGIVLGALRPGEKLTEIGLAASLQVSRATVREALGQLVQEGLLVSEAYRGIRVAELDAAAVADLARTRVALDLLAVSSIVADDRRLAALLEAWHVFEAQIHDPDPLRRHDAHLGFHRAVWTAAENVVLDQLWPVIEANLTLALAEDQRLRPNPDRSHRIHAALVAAIVSRDLVRVEAALQVHTLDTAADLVAACHAGEPTGPPDPAPPPGP